MKPQLDLLTYAPRLVAHMKALGLAKGPLPPPVDAPAPRPHKLEPREHSILLAIVARACVLGGMTPEQLMGSKTKSQCGNQSQLKQMVVAAIRKRTGASYNNIGAVFGMSPGGCQTCEKYGLRYVQGNPNDRVWKELMKA